MNKLLILSAITLTILVLVPSLEAKKKKGKLLTDLCEKCEYCETDPDCSGCAKCSECKSRKDYGCKFCKRNEDEAKCVERCTKGCGICEKLESCREK